MLDWSTIRLSGTHYHTVLAVPISSGPRRVTLPTKHRHIILLQGGLLSHPPHVDHALDTRLSSNSPSRARRYECRPREYDIASWDLQILRRMFTLRSPKSSRPSSIAIFELSRHAQQSGGSVATRIICVLTVDFILKAELWGLRHRVSHLTGCQSLTGDLKDQSPTTRV